MLHYIKWSILESLAHIKSMSFPWQSLVMMNANQRNISHVVEIFDSLLTYKKDDLSLFRRTLTDCRPFFKRLPFICPPPQTLWRWGIITRISILTSILVGFIPPSHPRLEALFSLVTMYVASSSISSLLLVGSWLVRFWRDNFVRPLNTYKLGSKQAINSPI